MGGGPGKEAAHLCAESDLRHRVTIPLDVNVEIAAAKHAVDQVADSVWMPRVSQRSWFCGTIAAIEPATLTGARGRHAGPYICRFETDDDRAGENLRLHCTAALADHRIASLLAECGVRRH